MQICATVSPTLRLWDASRTLTRILKWASSSHSVILWSTIESWQRRSGRLRISFTVYLQQLGVPCTHYYELFSFLVQLGNYFHREPSALLSPRLHLSRWWHDMWQCSIIGKQWKPLCMMPGLGFGRTNGAGEPSSYRMKRWCRFKQLLVVEH